MNVILPNLVAQQAVQRTAEELEVMNSLNRAATMPTLMLLETSFPSKVFITKYLFLC